MESHREACNRFLVNVFDEILKTEELCLTGPFPDLSLRELHLIEDVCRAVDEGGDNRASALAAEQRVTPGTLTTVTTLLEKKGYLERRKDPNDRRAVRIYPTEKGRQADVHHAKFHQEMVAEALSTLTDEQADMLVSALARLTAFFEKEYHVKGVDPV